MKPKRTVDLFAGAGGFSLGWKMATGTEPILAINHDPHAILVHKANHRDTLHLREDVRNVVADDFDDEEVDHVHASPDCTHFSRARGRRPKRKEIRSLAWALVSWGSATRPKVITLENVEEFKTWGPLYPADHADPKLRAEPIPELAGITFDAFILALSTGVPVDHPAWAANEIPAECQEAARRGLGHVVEWRLLNARDFKTPTNRKRLLLVARRDGKPIRWPEPTNGPRRARPYRVAAECIDWKKRGKSIFGRKKALAEATERRIAAGFVKYVLTAEHPFIIERDGNQVTIPSLIQLGYGERKEKEGKRRRRKAQKPRVLDLQQPLGTVVAGGVKHGLVEADLIRFPFIVQTGHQTRDGGKVRSVQEPLATLCRKADHLLVEPELRRVTPRVAAWLAKHYGGPNGHMTPGSSLAAPFGAITAKDHHALVEAELLPLDEETRGKAELCAAYLVKWYGQGGQLQTLDEPLHTVVSKARFGLIEVVIDGETWVVVDIRLRMLTPRELARAMGFPDDYQIEIGTIADQVARMGNAMCPPLVEALIRALYDLDEEAEGTEWREAA